MAHRLEARAQGAASAASGAASAFRRAAFAGLWITCALVYGANAAAADTASALLTHVTGNPTIVELTVGAPRHVSYAVAGRSYGLPLEIETGARDTATFALPNSIIEVSPNTLMRVVAPERSGGGLVQRILQQGGSSLFRVHRGTIDRFQVETPFLVSVVKGTVFNVLVQDDGATVSLQEGRLEVDSVDAKQTVMLKPGDVAFAGRDGVLRLLQLQVTDNAAARPSATPTKSSSSVDARDTASSSGDALASTAGEVGSPTSPVSAVAVTTVSNVVQPVVATVVAPMVNAVVAPVVDTVAAPVVTSVVTPIVNTVVTPVVSTITTAVTAPVVNTVTPVVAPVTNIVAPVIAPVVPTVTTVVASVTPVVAPVVAPITTVTSTVTAPVAPIVNNATALLGGHR